jgi:transposase
VTLQAFSILCLSRIRQWQSLQTISGMDRIGALMLLAEIGTNMERFSSAARPGARAGMCPGNQKSAGKKGGAPRPAISMCGGCYSKPTLP